MDGRPNTGHPAVPEMAFDDLYGAIKSAVLNARQVRA